ncbi:MAG TPA: hypothetical protein VHW66_10605 [Stellaceae bacterium]|jgi:hypothetical protein|nr:hypothetical protein [Stellaceae bacterium]
MLLAIVKYVVLTGCAASWVYAAFHGARFEERLSNATRNPFEIEALNRPATLFRSDLPKRAIESRRKVYAGLAVMFVLGLCLLVILYFDAAGPVRSPFLYSTPRGS